MKNKFTFTFYLFSHACLLGFFSCGEKCPTCPKDIKLTECLDSLIPYHQNDIVRFANTVGDTLQFTCTERIYDKAIQYPDESRLQTECCHSYTAEIISCNFAKTDSTDFGFYLQNDKTYTLVSYLKLADIKIHGFFTVPNSCPFDNGNTLLKDIVVAGKMFQDVSTSSDANGNKLHFSYQNLGIVGFIKEGKEWALLE